MPASSASRTTGAPVRSAAILRNALAYAGALGLPIVDHAEDPTQTAGAEANDGFVATVLGLRGWPAAAEEAAVARDLAILADVVRDVPGARLHLTHVSTAGALDLVRRAKAAGLPVTCDVTPHHLALTDEWLAGARRWAWDGADGDPWARRRDRSRRAVRVVAAGQPAAANAGGRGRRAWRPCVDGTADAIATDHAPAHRGRQGRRVRAGGERDQRHRDGARAWCSRRSTPGSCTLAARDRGADDRAGRRARRGRAARHGRPGRGRAGRPRRVRSLGARGRSPPTPSRRAARTRRCSGWRSRARAADDGRRPPRLRGRRPSSPPSPEGRCPVADNIRPSCNGLVRTSVIYVHRVKTIM